MIDDTLGFLDISRGQTFVQAGKERWSCLSQSFRDCFVQLFQPTLDPNSPLGIDSRGIRTKSVSALHTIPIHGNHSSVLIDDL